MDARPRDGGFRLEALVEDRGEHRGECRAQAAPAAPEREREPLVVGRQGRRHPALQAVARARLAEGDVRLAEEVVQLHVEPGTQTPAPTPSECVRAHACPWPSTATMFVALRARGSRLQRRHEVEDLLPLAQAGEAGHAREELVGPGQATAGRDPVAVELHAGRVAPSRLVVAQVVPGEDDTGDRHEGLGQRAPVALRALLGEY